MHALDCLKDRQVVCSIVYLIAIEVHLKKHAKLAVFCVTDHLGQSDTLSSYTQSSKKAKTQTFFTKKKAECW